VFRGDTGEYWFSSESPELGGVNCACDVYGRGCACCDGVGGGDVEVLLLGNSAGGAVRTDVMVVVVRYCEFLGCGVLKFVERMVGKRVRWFCWVSCVRCGADSVKVEASLSSQLVEAAPAGLVAQAAAIDISQMRRAVNTLACLPISNLKQRLLLLDAERLQQAAIWRLGRRAR
jgi:hypothetical protein